ncbi:MAG: fadB1 [Bradyrhizobium sp.]|nr:fadB1 [Bradyrhizobium sp.]
MNGVYSEILCATRDGVAVIALNRPDQLNAWTPTMEGEVRDAMLRADADPEAHVIIITGEGRGFCAGADLKAGRASVAPPPGAGDFDQRYSYIAGLDTPVIAAINGAVAGVGLCIALYCDLRFIAAGAKLTTAFARRGLIAEHGSAWLLPRLVGPMTALDLLMTGRTVIGEEAAALGLARCLPAENFRESVEQYARDLVTQSSPRSLRVIKRQVREAMRSSLGDAILLSNEEQQASLQSRDFQEGVAAFRERRPPHFIGS